MISYPHIGQRVQLHYGAGWRRVVGSLHGRVGVVRVPSRGKPRNHGVEVDGRIVVVPCGNLRTAPANGGTK